MEIENALGLGLVLAGIGQIGLVVVTPYIVHLLGWRRKTDVLDPLVRTVFWTYAGYILTTNLAFGLASVFLTGQLLAGTPLAAAVVGFIMLYWGVRLVLQFVKYRAAYAHPNWISRAGETAMNLLFLYLTLAYGAALAFNLGALWA